MLFVQIIIYCVLFTLLVKICVIGGAENALYFYPKPVQERAFEIGLAKREDIAKKWFGFFEDTYAEIKVKTGNKN